MYALKTARWKTRGVFLDRHVRRKIFCCESLTTITIIWCVCGVTVQVRSCLTFLFSQQLCFLFCIRDVSCSKGLKWHESVWKRDSPRDSGFFFRILIWIQLPEGRLAGVTWMWHTDPRWPGIVSCLLEWHCHFTNVLGHQLLYRIIMHNTWGSIWPPNSTDNELFKGHLQKIYKYCQAVEAMGNRHNV